MQIWGPTTSLNILNPNNQIKINKTETNKVEANKVETEKILEKWKNITKDIKNFWWKLLNIFLWTGDKTQENLLNKAAFEDKIKQKSEEKIKKEFEKEEEEKNFYLNLSQEKKDEIINWNNLVEKMKLASAWIKNLEWFQ